ncbi:hypothetical protein [Streptomyces sp. NPDC046939]|uniref:hypothetical protein n=1 Tax=Streptomyces sp. NPDC046939 TaxID=3155376 RepID=UPI0033DCC7C5
MAGVAVTVLLLVTAVVVPATLAGSVDATSCWHVPAPTRALVDDSAAATRFLDPMNGTRRIAVTVPGMSAG